MSLIASPAARRLAPAATRGQVRPPRALALTACALLLASLAGCSSLLGGGNKQAPTIFAPQPPLRTDPAWPVASWQLSVARTEAPRVIDTTRIVVRPVPGQLQVYKGASWALSPTAQIEEVVLRTLEDSGKIQGVAHQASGIAADYRLAMNLRRYDADYAGGTTPSAVIDLNVKLLRAVDQEVIGSRTFQQVVQAGGTDVAQVSQAFTQALTAIGHDVAGWVLVTGQAAHDHTPAPAQPPPARGR